MTTMVNRNNWRPAHAATTPILVNSSQIRHSFAVADFDDVRGIVSRALDRARSLGRDGLTQTRAAAQAILAVRPDMTPAQAFDAVARMQAAGAV